MSALNMTVLALSAMATLTNAIELLDYTYGDGVKYEEGSIEYNCNENGNTTGCVTEYCYSNIYVTAEGHRYTSRINWYDDQSTPNVNEKKEWNKEHWWCWEADWDEVKCKCKRWGCVERKMNPKWITNVSRKNSWS